MVCFDEGSVTTHGSGTGDGMLKDEQEDTKAWTSSVGAEDGFAFNNGYWYVYPDTGFSISGTYVLGHWECEFSVPFVGIDKDGDPLLEDLSDLVCTVNDIIGMKFHYINYEDMVNYNSSRRHQSANTDTYTTLSFAPTPSASVTVTPDPVFIGQPVEISGQVVPEDYYSLWINTIKPDGSQKSAGAVATNMYGDFLIPSYLPDGGVGSSMQFWFMKIA